MQKLKNVWHFFETRIIEDDIPLLKSYYYSPGLGRAACQASVRAHCRIGLLLPTTADHSPVVLSLNAVELNSRDVRGVL